jgi:hypothetical protein
MKLASASSTWTASIELASSAHLFPTENVSKVTF